MHRPFRVLSRAAALALAGTCCAQTVYVVDRQNRPGANFTDLPAAEAAAQHGDTIVLRSDASPYTPVNTSKALSIVGDPSDIARFTATPGGFQISGIPAGRDFVLRNCEIFATGAATSSVLRVQGCLGRVHLQQVQTASYAGTPGLEIVACTAVTLREFEGQGHPALLARNATLAIADSRFYGGAASLAFPLQAGAGLALIDSTAFLSRVQVNGGIADRTSPPAPAATLIGSSVSFAGAGVGSHLFAGPIGTNGAPASVPAILAQNSFLRLDPSAVVQARGGAPAFVGVTPTYATLATLSCTGRSNFFIAVTGAPGSVQAMLLGQPGDPIAIGGVEGRLWLDPRTLVTLPGNLTGFSEYFLPSGITFAIQVASYGPGGFELTVPAVVTNRR